MDGKLHMEEVATGLVNATRLHDKVSEDMSRDGGVIGVASCIFTIEASIPRSKLTYEDCSTLSTHRS